VLDRLRPNVEAKFAAKVAFLQEIVCFLSRRGQEAPLQDWIARDMAAHGYAIERFTITGTPLAAHAKAASMIEAHATASVQVMATHRAASPTGRSPIPQGHIGLVPEGPLKMWTHPPYAGVVRDSWLYGRGTNAMKAGVAGIAGMIW
jgi:acetylornithine deacetylase